MTSARFSPSFFSKVYSPVLAAAIAVALTGSLAWAQKPATSTPTTGNTGATTGNPLPTTTRTPTITNPTNSPNQTNFPTIQRPIFLSGKVQISDGTPLPTGITIERVCSANTRTVAYTDSKGRFQFEWNKNNGIMPDASNSNTRGMMGADNGFGSSGSNSPFGNMGNASEMEMMTCELRAVAPGYRSDLVNLAGHRSLDNPDVGVIVLHRLGNVEGTSISATSFNAPKDAKKAYDKGIELSHKGKSEDAAKNFEKAVAGYPRYADAWYQLGLAYNTANDKEHAREAYTKALEADGKLVGPTVELGLMSFRDKNWKEATEYLDRALRLDPVDYPQAWFAHAVAEYNLKNYDAAEKSARESVKLDPKKRNPRAGYLLGLILAEKGDLAGATTQLKEFLQLSPNAPDAETVRKQLTQIESFASSRPAPATPEKQQ